MRRGDVTLWLTPDAIATWAAAGVGRRSGQLQYSDLAIETALTLSLIFHVPLRQTEGIVRLRVQVAQWTDEQPDTELSRLPIPA